MAGVVLIGNGFEHGDGVAVASEFAREEFGNAGDGRGAHSGLVFDDGIGSAFGKHFGDLETSGEFDDFLFGEHIAKEGENAIRRIRTGEDFADLEGVRLKRRRFHLL